MKHDIVTPDGGWGWVIVFSSFMLNVLLDGVITSSGIFLVYFMEYFRSNTGATAWIPSILTGTYLISGPVASVLVQIFGARKVSLCGSIIAASGLFVSTFSANLEEMIVLHGALCGLGFGLTYLPSIVLVGQYFDKKRAVATGIAVCGSGIGGIIFPPLSVYLIEMYGWKGALWVISGIVLNGAVFGGLYRALPKLSIENYNKEQNGAKNTSHDLKMTDSKSKSEPVNLLNIKPICDHSEIKTVRENQSDYRYGKEIVVTAPKHIPVNEVYKGKVKEISSLDSLTTRLKKVASICDISLLCSPTFVLYTTSAFLRASAFYMPVIFLPKFGNNIGLSTTQQAMAVSTISIASTIGRVAVGFLSDRPWANALIINNSAMIIIGVATLLVPFITNYWLLTIYSVIFGLGIACPACLMSPLLVEFLGKDRLTSSFGLSSLFRGIAAFIGPPIAGSLVDLTGDYALSFYVGGSAFVMTGIICIPLRKISDWERSRLKNASTTS